MSGRGRSALALIGALFVSACGERPPDTVTKTSAVVGGTPVPSSERPATGALVVVEEGDSPSSVCTGTVIAPRVVLTAAHCLVLNVGVLDFTFDASVAEAGSVIRGVASHVDPDFAIGTSVGLENDLGILELAEPVDVAPAALPAPADAAPYLIVGASVDLVGYGDTATDGSGNGTRNAGRAAIASVDGQELVVGGADAGVVQSCTGDSGGPAYAPVEPPAAGWLLGIASRSAGTDSCVEGAVQIRVDAHRAWIDETVQQIEAPPAGCAVAGTSPSPFPALLVALAILGRRWRSRAVVRRG